MAFKRALVVDDSRTARQSLARLLSQHDVEVAFAESGEAALQFLREELVDVIFMDHTMPGMDGLEAVSAIKNNPRTATIPVMMYTTKEGEVYVSQARALGAVGVLPKQFHPNVLFEMLQKLGLVTDRRSATGPEEQEPQTPRRRITDVTDDVEEEYERRALGISVQTLVTRILEEQHLKLRAEILSGQRQFARQVASEILERHPADSDPAGGRRPGDPATGPARSAATVMTGILAVATLVLGTVAWQMLQERNAARVEIARMNTASRNELDVLTRRNAGLDASLQERMAAAEARRRDAFAALQWALNQQTAVPFGAQPFDDRAADSLTELLVRLARLGYPGSITVTARMAPFCLVRDDAGELVQAAAGQPLEACEEFGHPLQDVASPEALQSVAFAGVASSAPVDHGIGVRLAIRHELASDATRFPGNLQNAGDWNRLAADYNRLEFTLDPQREVAARR